MVNPDEPLQCPRCDWTGPAYQAILSRHYYAEDRHHMRADCPNGHWIMGVTFRIATATHNFGPGFGLSQFHLDHQFSTGGHRQTQPLRCPRRVCSGCSSRLCPPTGRTCTQTEPTGDGPEPGVCHEAVLHDAVLGHDRALGGVRAASGCPPRASFRHRYARHRELHHEPRLNRHGALVARRLSYRHSARLARLSSARHSLHGCAPQPSKSSTGWYHWHISHTLMACR